MNKIILTILVLLLLSLGPPACGTLGDAPKVPTMTEAEYAQWEATAVAQVSALVDAAVAEGDLQPEQVATFADALSGFGSGSAVSLAGLLDESSGYAQLALAFLLMELDVQLAPGGVVTDRGKSFALALGAALKE